MDSRHSATPSLNLFSFRARNLPDTALAVLVSEVNTITDAVEISPIPLAPLAIYGICYWDHLVIPVLDLAAALCGKSVPASLHPDQRIMIAKVPVQDTFHYLGWPIEGNASLVQVKGMVHRAPTPPTFASKLIEESISIENDHLVILRLAGLFD